LVRLVTDQEEDEVSNKAYSCLEALGEPGVKALLLHLSKWSHNRTPWKHNGSLIIDLVFRKERHLLLEKTGAKMNDNQILTYMKKTGPKDVSELLEVKES